MLQDIQIEEKNCLRFFSFFIILLKEKEYLVALSLKGEIMETKKKLKLFDIICLSFASFFSVELVASQASIGPSMVICMLIFGGAYLLCHGLICAELGGAYPDQGGIYVWVLNAFGPKWAARTTWYYWVNVVGFVPCTLVALIVVFQQIFVPDMSITLLTAFSIVGTWIVVALNCISLNESKFLTNLGTILKFVCLVMLVCGGVYTLVKNGSANEFTAETIFPVFDMNLLMLLPVYIYSLTGMDLLSCNAGMMDQPEKNVPKSVFVTGVVSIIVYILSALAVLFILPLDAIDASASMIDAIITVYGASRMLVIFFGLALVIVYGSYIFSWAIGGNATALQAGEEGELPKIFAKTNKAGAPVGPAVLLGIASTVLLVFYGMVASSNEGLFWTLLAFTSIIFLLPYFIMSFVFLKLRKDDPDHPRPFKVGGKVFPKVIAYLHAVFIAIAIIGYTLPPEGEDPVSYLIIVAGGVLLTVLIGEWALNVARKNKEAK